MILVDGGYRGKCIEIVKEKFQYILEVTMLPKEKKEKKKFKILPKRWVVERTFSWFQNFRRLNRNYELLFESSEQMVKLAAIKNLLNKI